jgi:hypothetical protein
LIGGHSGFLIGINETGEGFLSMLTFASPVVSLLFDSDEEPTMSKDIGDELYHIAGNAAVYDPIC